MEEKDVPAWNCEDVRSWLEKHGFENYGYKFCVQHKIDGPVLLSLQESDLRQPPLQLEVLGDIKRLSTCIKKLQTDTFGDEAKFLGRDSVDAASSHNVLPSTTPRVHRLLSNESLSDNEDEVIDEEVERIVNRTGRYTKNVHPEIFKTTLSFIYVFVVFLVTSFVMTIVHDRVPDPQKYPPLPDLFLDNMPYIPWAFEMCEMVGVTLFTIWACILFFHKHR